jgi:hypothetical protein
MPDAAHQLQDLYLAGFEIETFERYPNSVGVIKGNCIALLQTTATGLRLIGDPGWRMGEVMGVLVNRTDGRYFQAKDELVEATTERLSELEHFRQELDALISAQA